MSYFGYSPSSGPPVSASTLPTTPMYNNNNNNQLLGSPNSSSGGGGGMSGSTSPTGITTSPSGTTSCCGRPPSQLIIDPVTGSSVCQCQYDPSRLTLSSYPRLTAYGPSPYAPPSEQNPYPSLDSSAFYSPLGGAGVASSADVSWGPNPIQSGYYPYDFAAAYGGFGAAGYDLQARRKNATRESTATLKAWLNEHKKNPYPTKGEKIMLAIITKMTLTQVSTWFANARRRLKKENKMTWEPKNKTDDDEDDIKDDDDDDSSTAPPASSPGTNNKSNNNIGIKNDPSSDLKSDCAAPKQKIWSVADMATTPDHHPSQHMSHHYHASSHHNMSHPAPPPVSSYSFAYPISSFRYGNMLPQTNEITPPQTPPNLKVPMLPGSLSHFAPGPGNPSSGLGSSSDLATTAFKPVLKSSSGGFCM